MSSINESIVKTLMSQVEKQSSCVFFLSATIAVIEHRLKQNDTGFNQELVLILKLTSTMNENQLKAIIPSLTEVLVHILNALTLKIINETLGEHVMFIIINILKLCKMMFEDKIDNEKYLYKYLENIFKSLESTFKSASYPKLKENLVDILIECAPYLKKNKTLRNHILAIFNSSTNKNIAYKFDEKIMEALKIVEVNQTPKRKTDQQKVDLQKCTTPNNKATKKIKKVPSITNTVIENGEEFVVVKSNWKFNPRKMTENQKEKLLRKREDIPAMYQDLSQSQDAFRGWKSDSQDTTTSSKSTNVVNEDVSEILKNIPNTEILPKIIETVSNKPVIDLTFSEASEVKLNVNHHQSENTKMKNVLNKDTKSPRLALKDRVFRNAQNLIEGSSLDHNILKTPVSKIRPSSNVTNSAPPDINSERPSRVKRKPKKFDDLKLLSVTKRRRSLSIGDSQADVEIPENDISAKTNNTNCNIPIKENNKADSAEEQDDSIAKSKYSEKSLKDNENDKSEEKVTGIIEEKLCDTNVETEAAGLDMLEHEFDVNLGQDAADSNNIDQFVHNKINENVQGTKLCNPCPLSKKESLTTNVIKCGKKLDTKISTDAKQNNIISSPAKEDLTENEKIQTGKKNSILVVDKQKETIKEISSTDNNENCKKMTISDKIIKVKEVATIAKSSDGKNDAVTPLKPSDKTQAAENTKPKAVNNQSGQKEPIKSANKRSSKKKSRIESQLAIDMVAGHPCREILAGQSEKRSTRQSAVNLPLRRKRLSYNQINRKNEKKNKAENKTKEKEPSVLTKDTTNLEDITASQDIIESSQDSTVTSISVKPSKPLGNKEAIIILAKHVPVKDTPSLIDDPISVELTDKDGNNDTELPNNKTDLHNFTEEMDTEPIDCNVVLGVSDSHNLTEEMDTQPVCDAVIVLSDSEVDVPETATPVVYKDVSLDPEIINIQNTADAETEQVNPDIFSETDVTGTFGDADHNTPITDILETNKSTIETFETNASLITTAEDTTKTLSESALMETEKDDSSTACNNEQRKKDFLNNTLQISPIKSMSPVREDKSPSPETSSDYVVIKLTSPVQSNGQPFELCDSPEIFTEDKMSPDKRDESPPREEVSLKMSSPSSLSLKKNRPQMRSGGRAAQMLTLCVPDRLQSVKSSEKPSVVGELKRAPLNTTAIRNLRMLNCIDNSSAGENNDTSVDTEDSESFLKFKRTLPTTDCSPSGPILKRKLIDITDETTASPASKRKRVSFHDPPVSTTVCVKKYIEPIGLRSPQNSATKRLERLSRSHTLVKSPRRLENAFKLDSVLTKAVESFSEVPNNMTEEMSSLDETPVVEIVKTSDLNDTDPICNELVDCEDNISNIAAELSSPAMKDLLVKNFEGKVETVGDLAKMTELEVNRLSIKAPKVQVVKQVLNEYLLKRNQANAEITATVEAAMSESVMLEAQTSIEIQTDCVAVQSIESQTNRVAVSRVSSQTDAVVTSQSFVQTKECMSRSTKDVISDCLSERPDFIKTLCETLDGESKQKIIENLPQDLLLKALMDNMSKGQSNHVLNLLQDKLVKKFDCKDLILFCSSLLRNVYNKPT